MTVPGWYLTTGDFRALWRTHWWHCHPTGACTMQSAQIGRLHERQTAPLTGPGVRNNGCCGRARWAGRCLVRALGLRVGPWDRLGQRGHWGRLGRAAAKVPEASAPQPGELAGTLGQVKSPSPEPGAPMAVMLAPSRRDGIVRRDAPALDHRFPVLPPEHAQGTGDQSEKPAGGWVLAQPSGCQDPQ